MDFTFSDKTIELQRQLSHFMQKYVLPNQNSYHQDISKGIYPPPVLEDLKNLAKDEIKRAQEDHRNNVTASGYQHSRHIAP